MKTKTPKKEEISRDWYVVDAKDVRLGKLATGVAERIIGKSKPTFSPNFDNGDHVIIINAEKVSVHPRKLVGKIYYSHSGHIGKLKKTSLKEMMSKKPEEVVRLAVKGMLPKNKLGSGMLPRLYVYTGENHPHEGQKPIKIEIQ
ncbi:50S ribosomal protein L13 [Candidatus Dojkabacteria bacterium]|nr:50S ribosomal protein L13 [Candidatus Dojkabacteria bacterium]